MTQLRQLIQQSKIKSNSTGRDTVNSPDASMNRKHEVLTHNTLSTNLSHTSCKKKRIQKLTNAWKFNLFEFHLLIQLRNTTTIALNMYKWIE